MLLYRKVISFFKMNKKGVEWKSPEFIVVLILTILVGIAFIYFLLKLQGRVAP